MSHIYRSDLAYVQHVGQREFYESDAPAILSRLKTAGIDEGLIVDLGCGDGGWARFLCRSGYDVVGVDASPNLIEIATTLAPDAQFHVASLLEFALPPCAAVTMLGEPLNYALAQQPEFETEEFFQRVHAALPAGGMLLFDILVAAPDEPMHYKTWAAGDGWAVLANITEDLEHAIVRREITIFRQVEASYRRSEETHLLRVLAERDVVASLHRLGFSVDVVAGYGDTPLLPRRRAFIAQKGFS